MSDKDQAGRGIEVDPNLVNLQNLADTNYKLYQHECQRRLQTEVFILNTMTNGDVAELKKYDPALFDHLLKAFNDANGADIEILKRKASQYSARLQILWSFLMNLNEDTGIEPPSEYFEWFDEDGVPKINS